jgi:hypothetical protein
MKPAYLRVRDSTVIMGSTLAASHRARIGSMASLVLTESTGRDRALGRSQDLVRRTAGYRIGPKRAMNRNAGLWSSSGDEISPAPHNWPTLELGGSRCCRSRSRRLSGQR